MVLCDLGCLRIRLLAIRHSFGGGGGGGKRQAKEIKSCSFCLKEKGNQDCLIAGYCQRHFVDFYHNISNI